MVAVVVPSGSYSLIYSLTYLDYAVNLCGARIQHCANTYSTKDTHYVTKETQTTDVTSCPAGVMHKHSQGQVTARDLGGVDDSTARD